MIKVSDVIITFAMLAYLSWLVTITIAVPCGAPSWAMKAHAISACITLILIILAKISERIEKQK